MTNKAGEVRKIKIKVVLLVLLVLLAGHFVPLSSKHYQSETLCIQVHNRAHSFRVMKGELHKYTSPVEINQREIDQLDRNCFNFYGQKTTFLEIDKLYLW